MASIRNQQTQKEDAGTYDLIYYPFQNPDALAGFTQMLRRNWNLKTCLEKGENGIEQLSRLNEGADLDSSRDKKIIIHAEKELDKNESHVTSAKRS